MVLVCGDPYEAVTAFLCSRLTMLKFDHRVLDLGRFPEEYVLEVVWNGGQPDGSISGAHWRVTFDQLTGVYFRNVSPDGSVGEGEGKETIDRPYPLTHPRISAVLNSLPCPVVNRPASMHSSRSKPYQALIIREFGFKIPKTLVTNDPEAARSFYYECEGKVICKSITGIRSTVRRMTREDFECLEFLEHCPAQFQEYLAGDNIRVHVIGERLFAVRIQCGAVDYRYAGAEGYTRTMVPETLPEDVATNCIRLTKELGLAMSGIDLKETPAGEYYCFEVNTSPAFPFYESLARPAIADALAEHLAEKSA
jgi:glutathione synthase/RimK-type ligase-like ATP-grasp enzyme